MPDQATNDYLPVLILVLFAAGFAGFNVALNSLIGRRGSKNAMKDTAFECGMLPFTTERRRFSVKFYLVAVLFILFDIEVVFLYPWAVKFKELGLFGFVEMLLFLGVLLIGWWYVVRKGALDWSARPRLRVPQRSP